MRVERLPVRQVGLQMLLDEADAAPGALAQCGAGNWDLTISAASLTYQGGCRDNDTINFQGNYDYHAHAQVYTGGADPLGSQGYASVVRHPSSSLDAAREAQSSRAFLFLERHQA